MSYKCPAAALEGTVTDEQDEDQLLAGGYNGPAFAFTDHAGKFINTDFAAVQERFMFIPDIPPAIV